MGDAWYTSAQVGTRACFATTQTSCGMCVAQPQRCGFGEVYGVAHYLELRAKEVRGVDPRLGQEASF
eukprot:364955-Chlamydomonas_euryale.AAC.27